MNNEQKYWLGFFGLVAILICTLIISMTIHSITVSNLMDKEIMAGFDPVRVRCAHGGFYSSAVDVALCK